MVDACKICYTEISTDEDLLNCTSCKSGFHINHIAVWMHLGNVSCPYCKDELLNTQPSSLTSELSSLKSLDVLGVCQLCTDVIYTSESSVQCQVCQNHFHAGEIGHWIQFYRECPNCTSKLHPAEWDVLMALDSGELLNMEDVRNRLRTYRPPEDLQMMKIIAAPGNRRVFQKRDPEGSQDWVLDIVVEQSSEDVYTKSSNLGYLDSLSNSFDSNAYLLFQALIFISVFIGPSKDVLILEVMLLPVSALILKASNLLWDPRSTAAGYLRWVKALHLLFSAGVVFLILYIGLSFLIFRSRA